MKDDTFPESLASFFQRHHVPHLAAFLLRAHLPVSGILAHVVMFGEPFLRVCDIDAVPLRKLLQDRDALRHVIARLEDDYEETEHDR